MNNIKKRNILGIIFFVIGTLGFVLAGIFLIIVISHFEFNLQKIIQYSHKFLIEFLFLVIFFIIDLLLIYIGKKLSYSNIKINISEEENKIFKKNITKYIISTIILILLIFISISCIYHVFARTFLCVKEGESTDFIINKQCCWGLTRIGVCDEDGVCCGSCGVCAKCGDGICKEHENQNTCPKDCK